MKLRVVLVACLAALAAGATAHGGSYAPPPPDVEPAWSPDGQSLVYYRWYDGPRAVAAEGSGDHRIPGAPNTKLFSLSPDWRLLASVVYQGTPNAYALDLTDVATGATRTLVTDAGPATPVFSPDGARIAFARTDGVWTIGVDGSTPSRIAAAASPSQLAWSPDGTRIAYTVVGDGPHVEAARVDGSGVVAAHYAPSELPSWSPDGRELAYFTRNDAALDDLAGAAGRSVLPERGSEPPVWAKDGKAFYVAGSPSFRIPVDTGFPEKLPLETSWLSVAPDGTLAYSAAGNCGDRAGIYAGDRRLTNDCHVYGTDGPNRLRSSPFVYEIVDGRGGNDTLIARGAPYVGDELDGGAGDDVLRGGIEPDRLDGGPGDDTIYGGTNHDVLIGGPGRDRLYGQGGSDVIYARDGERDFVDCGTNTGRTNTTPELDRAYVDRYDVVVHCEKVFRSR